MIFPVALFGGSLGAGEILLVLTVMLLLFGAQRLPAIARSLGRALEEFRRAARDLTHDIIDDDASHDSTPKPPSAPDHPPEERQG